MRERILKTNEKLKQRINKKKKDVQFTSGDYVWIHLMREYFPLKRHSKLSPGTNDPFKVLDKINPNAYKIELPSEYGVFATFNVPYLSPFYEDEGDIPSFKLNFIKKGGCWRWSCSIHLTLVQRFEAHSFGW